MARLATAGQRWGLAIVVSLFVLLAGVYNIFTPVFESPDELQHGAFVAWVADTGRLPVLRAQDLGPWEQEGSQPPLYYWLSAALTGWVPRPDAYHLAEINPHAGGIGDPQRPDNKNRVIHDLSQEGWPWRGAPLFARLGRMVSTLIGAATLLGIYRLGRVACPHRPGLALAMTALVAFIPQFLFLSASINNDNLVVLVSTWTLVVLAGWLRRGTLPRWPHLALLGVLLGLGALSKLSGVLLWAPAGGVLLWLAWRAGRLRWLVGAAGLVFGLALALSAWWFVRNILLYDDLTGISAHLLVMGRREPPASLSAAMAEFRGFRYSFWALFGWFNVLVPNFYYWIADALTVVGLAGLALFWVRHVRAGRRRVATEPLEPAPANPGVSVPVLVLLLAWTGLVVAGLLRWTLLTPASQGRLLFPALGPVGLCLAVGLAELIPPRLRAPAGLAALAGWIGWAAVCPLLFIAPTYAQPPRVRSLADLNVVPSILNVRYGDCCDLVGYVQPSEPIHAGERVPLTLIWRARRAVDKDYSVFVHASSTDGEIQGQIDTYPGGGRYPTSHWQPGEIVADTVYVPMSLDAQGPALILFNVGLYEYSNRQELSAYSADGDKIKHVFAGEAALEPFDWPVPQPQIETDALFGQEVRLVGASLSQTTAQPGEVVTVTLEWLAMADIRDDYIGFVHLFSPAAERKAQDDHMPLDGRYPTRLWSRGTMLADPYRLELPAGLEPGSYDLWGGLYLPESSERLQAVHWQTGERWKDNLVYIARLTVR